jgi:hypothetical protein
MISILLCPLKMNGWLASVDLEHQIVKEWLIGYYGVNLNIGCYDQNLDIGDTC